MSGLLCDSLGSDLLHGFDDLCDGSPVASPHSLGKVFRELGHGFGLRVSGFVSAELYPPDRQNGKGLLRTTTFCGLAGISHNMLWWTLGADRCTPPGGDKTPLAPPR